MSTINKLPKVELHLHLDCSLSYQAVSRIDPAISKEKFESEFVAPPKCASLADFLTRAPRGFKLMQSVDALRLVMEDVFEQLAADNVIYAEIRFAPLLHLEKGLSPHNVVDALNRATEECIRATGIEARLILCSLRHFNEQQTLETVKLVDEFNGSHVVALDLAGDEAGYSIDPHIAAYRYALERGIRRTAHAGEAAGAESVWQTLRAFAPERIAHGARSIEDPALIEHLKKEHIHLEICPTSNVQTSVCEDYGSHPVDRMFRAGVSLGINTDTRTITNITLNEEYARLHRHFGWTQKDFQSCNRAALDAAFVDDETRGRLTTRLHVAQKW